MSTRITFEQDSVLLTMLRHEALRHQVIAFPVPLGDVIVRVQIPLAFTRRDADRICRVVSALAS